MAHKGKLGPVLFRRDWNLNVDSYDDGYGNRYITTTHTPTGGLGTIVAHDIWDCGPATFAVPNIMFWLSDVHTHGIADFQVRMESVILPGGSSYDHYGYLFELHVGTISKWRWGPSHMTDPVFFNVSGLGTTISWDPAWFDSDPMFYNNTPSIKRWIDGPPH